MKNKRSGDKGIDCMLPRPQKVNTRSYSPEQEIFIEVKVNIYFDERELTFVSTKLFYFN